MVGSFGLLWSSLIESDRGSLQGWNEKSRGKAMISRVVEL